MHHHLRLRPRIPRLLVRLLGALGAACCAELCASGSDISGGAAAGLWDLSEVRRQPLDPECLGAPRRVPFAAEEGRGDWMSTGDAWVAGGKAQAPSGGLPGGGAFPVPQSLTVEEWHLSSESTPQGPNRIYCAVARPEAQQGPVPVVLIFHGGGGHASPALALAAARRHPGMAGVAMDYNGQFAPGGGAHVTRWRNVTREQRLNLVPDLRNWPMYHNVTAARRTIDWLETQPWADRDRIGCVGVSYGGWVALLLAGVDSRVKCVTTGVSAGGVGGTAGKAAQQLRWDPPEQRAIWLEHYEPLAYAHRTRAGVFLQLASNDYWFWITGAARQLGALSGPSGWLVRPNSNHGAGGPELSDLAAPAFMRHRLLGAPALPRVESFGVIEKGAAYEWTVGSVGAREVVRAALYWSPGQAIDSARYWLECPAERVGGGRWRARVPAGMASLAARAYANAMTDDGLVVSGSLLEKVGVDPATETVAGWDGEAFWDLARGAAAWRTPGPWLPKTEIRDAEAGVALRPAGEGIEFCALTNSVGLLAGRLARMAGLRLRIDGRGQPGRLKVTLARHSMSMDEIAGTAFLDYGAAQAEYRLRWEDFRIETKDTVARPLPFPVDALQLSGQRTGGVPLIVGRIELLPFPSAVP